MFNKLKLKELVKSMYDVADVENGYNYWFNKLLNICLSMFKYNNCPETIPEREIALNIIMLGYCIFMKKNGLPYVVPSTLYNEQKSPYYYPKSAVYAQPALGSANLDIGANCEIIYCNKLQANAFMLPTDGGLLTFIQRYARMLADIESTINIYTVNCRLTSFPTAANDNVKNSIERLFQKVTLGRRGVISDNAIVEQFRNIDIGTSINRDGINDLLIARDKILEMFYRDIGIKMYNPKKAQVNEEELESNNQLLVVNTSEMIDTQNEGFINVNKFLGTDMNVEMSDAFKISNNVFTEGGNEYAAEIEE